MIVFGSYSWFTVGSGSEFFWKMVAKFRVAQKIGQGLVMYQFVIHLITYLRGFM